MKRALLLLLCLLLALGGLLSTAIGVNQAKDQVILTERTRSGSPDAANGLSALLRFSVSDRLNWSTALRFGNAPEIQTDFRYAPNRLRMPVNERRPDGLSLICGGFGGISSSGGINFDSDVYGNYYYFDLFKAVSERTPAGQSRTETLRIADYYRYYPLSVSLELPGSWLRWEQDGVSMTQNMHDDGGSILRALAERFLIPVHPQDHITITIRKNEAGMPVEADSRQPSDKPERCCPELYGFSVVAPERCWFTFTNRYGDGSAIEGGLFPGGVHGLYALPFSTDGKTTDVSPDDITLAYPFPEESQVVDLTLSADEKRLLLQCWEQGKLWLNVLDAADGKLLQRLCLLEEQPDVDLCWSKYEAGYFVLFTGRSRFLVVEEQPDGSYRIALLGSTAEANELGLPYAKSDLHTAWNGKKLALADYTVENWESRCGFVLAVWDTDGLCYVGSFENSLDVEGYGTNDLCHPATYTDPLLLRWDD